MLFGCVFITNYQGKHFIPQAFLRDFHRGQMQMFKSVAKNEEEKHLENAIFSFYLGKFSYALKNHDNNNYCRSPHYETERVINEITENIYNFMRKFHKKWE